MIKLINNDDSIPFKEIDQFTIKRKRLVVESLLIKATAYLKLEKKDEAKSIIEKANSIADRYHLDLIGPPFLKAMILMDKLKIKKDFAEAYTALGVCDYNLGNVDASIDYLNKSIDLKPELTSAHISLYKIEAYKNRASASDFGAYWTSSSKRLLALALIISVAALARDIA